MKSFHHRKNKEVLTKSPKDTENTDDPFDVKSLEFDDISDIEQERLR